QPTSSQAARTTTAAPPLVEPGEVPSSASRMGTVSVPAPALNVATTPTASRPDPESAAAKSPGGPGKAKVAETLRVESDRLDYLMNLAGELVITKARFVAISRGLEELFRGSNAHALASDTRERIESMTRGLEGLAESKIGTSGGSIDRWSVH